MLQGLTEDVGLVDFYLAEVQKLPKKEITFSICDIDDTLFSRKEQLENEDELVKRRWSKGNTYMINTIGIHNMIQKYYKGKAYPQDIIGTLSPENSLLLTAGVVEYQKSKVSAMNLNNYPIKIVQRGKDKILATLRYIIFELKYIPSHITLYEDRPEYFIEYRDFLESILWCTLTIIHVEMDGNDGYKKKAKV